MDAKNYISLKSENGVATIALSRADRGNSLTPDMVKELVRVLEFLKARSDVRVVVLTGSGKFFCTGMDLNPANQAEMQGKMSSGTQIHFSIGCPFSCLQTLYPAPLISTLSLL